MGEGGGEKRKKGTSDGGKGDGEGGRREGSRDLKKKSRAGKFRKGKLIEKIISGKNENSWCKIAWKKKGISEGSKMWPARSRVVKGTRLFASEIRQRERKNEKKIRAHNFSEE